jgi:hypothetical protein
MVQTDFVTPDPSSKLPISTTANEMLTHSLMDNTPPVGPIGSFKPLVPTRVAPQIPTSAPVPPVPPRTNAQKTEQLPSAVQESTVYIQQVVPSQVSAEVAFAIERRNEIKTAALLAKRSGDQAAALQYVRLVKVIFFFIHVFLICYVIIYFFLFLDVRSVDK